MAGPYWTEDAWRERWGGEGRGEARGRAEHERWSGPERGWRERERGAEREREPGREPGWRDDERWAREGDEPHRAWREQTHGGTGERWDEGRGPRQREDDPRRAPQRGSRDDGGWTGGVRGNEGGGGYGRGLFGTAYALYAGRDETRSERPAGKPPKGYRRSDERILDDIVERLLWSGVNVADAEVRVENGEVTLTGTTGSRRDRRLIEDVCEDVHGVKDVHNQLRVERTGEGAERTH